MTKHDHSGRHFAARHRDIVKMARARAALQLACGIDLDDALARKAPGRELFLRIHRALKRERLKGLARHWSYDLNRHIALKQALELIQDASKATSSSYSVALA